MKRKPKKLPKGVYFSLSKGFVDENGKPVGYGKWDFIVGKPKKK